MASCIARVYWCTAEQMNITPRNRTRAMKQHAQTQPNALQPGQRHGNADPPMVEGTLNCVRKNLFASKEFFQNKFGAQGLVWAGRSAWDRQLNSKNQRQHADQHAVTAVHKQTSDSRYTMVVSRHQSSIEDENASNLKFNSNVMYKQTDSMWLTDIENFLNQS